MIEVFLPAPQADRIGESLAEGEFEIHGIWTEPVDGGKKLVRVLVSSGGTEPIVDELERRFKGLEDFRVVLLPAEATLPRPEPQEGADAGKQDSGRLNREELYADALETARLNPVFLVMVVLSTVVAAVGLLRDNPVIVLSAMVIAPLLGPNMALALATTLGDRELARTAMRSAVAGLVLALAFACGIGWVLSLESLGPGIDPELAEIESRTEIGLGDIVLALAAGAAGALSLTSGASSTLIGVMVAVALLPPTVVTGLLTGAGEWSGAVLAAELVATNLLCLVTAAIVVFLVRGIRPATWWEAEKAKRATRRALIAGAVLLVALVALILEQARHERGVGAQLEELARPSD